MMKHVKKIIAIALVMMLAVTTMGCAVIQELFGDFDAQKYVRGTMDAAYKGQFEEYVETTDSTQEEAESEYEEMIDEIFNSFIYDLALTDEQQEEMKELTIKYLNSAKYEVMEAKKISKTEYDVDVKVEGLVDFEFDDAAYEQDLMERYDAGEFDGMSDSELQEVLSAEVFQMLKEYIENPQYGDEETVTIKVKADSNNIFEISDSDIDKLHSAIFGI